MPYLHKDIINRPFITLLVKKIKLSKIMSSGEKTKLLNKINDYNFLSDIKKQFNQLFFSKEDIDNIIAFLQEN